MDGDECPPGVPSWVARLDLPVWVSGPDRTICYANSRARTLFGAEWHRIRSRRCYEVVAGTDSTGLPICGPDCPVHRTAQSGGKIRPLDVSVRGRGGRTWLHLLVIPVESQPGLPLLVHCAEPCDRTIRVLDYVGRLAARSHTHPASSRRLTDREREILNLLAGDETLYGIADSLDLSYTTVRNHVQHILLKLGAHSVQEAVARWLLETAESPRS